MRIDTVWIRRKRDGVKRKINAIDYASDLGMGKYAAWELVRESHGDKTDDMVSGKSLGIDALVPAKAVEVAEQNAQETNEYKAVKKRGRPRKQPQVEVVDKEG